MFVKFFKKNMSVDCSDNAGSSVDTSRNSETCTSADVSTDAKSSVKTANVSHDIDSAANGSIANHRNGSVHNPISTDDAEIETIPNGNTSRTKKSRCSRRSFLPCIRLVVFILIIVVLLLICKLKRSFACEFMLMLL